MTEAMLHTVTALIDGGHGDADMLMQIRRALERGEVISASEARYVRRLESEHLRPKRAAQQAARAGSEQAAARAPQFTGRKVDARRRGRIARLLGRRRDSKQRRRPRMRRVAVIAVIAVVAAAGAAAYMGLQQPGAGTERVMPLQPGVMLATDQNAYSPGDIIVIQGASDPGATVSLSITNDLGATVWSSQAQAGADGGYSSMAIAAGADWRLNAAHTLAATDAAGTRQSVFMLVP